MSEAYVCVMQVKYGESHAIFCFFPIFGVQLNARIEKNASS